jgi:hypothetical protein
VNSSMDLYNSEFYWLCIKACSQPQSEPAIITKGELIDGIPVSGSNRSESL